MTSRAYQAGREIRNNAGMDQPLATQDLAAIRWLFMRTGYFATLMCPGDPTVYKHGYSAFHQTELDLVLRGLGVRYLIVIGCTTSVCVETAIREAHARDYSCILLEDCTAEPIGHGAQGYIGVPGVSGSSGGANHDASLVIIQTLFGWVSNSESITKALEMKQAIAIQA